MMEKRKEKRQYVVSFSIEVDGLQVIHSAYNPKYNNMNGGGYGITASNLFTLAEAKAHIKKINLDDAVIMKVTHQ
jgi:hypothetical protein